MTGLAMVYGATGFTGRLVVERAAARGLRPIVAGRREHAVRAVAERYGLDRRCFPLDDPDAVMRGLDGVAVVMNAAGPFSVTSRPMVDACFATGTHYCDLTGEVDVFVALAGRDAEAAEAGIMLLPGAGFDVVPSDCLLARVASRVGRASRLRLSIAGSPRLSRGTARTMLCLAGRGTAVRRGGEIVWDRGVRRATEDFGRGPVPTIGVSYGDVVTAGRSTGANDVEVFVNAPAIFASAFNGATVARILDSTLGRKLARGAIDLIVPDGPGEVERAGRSMTLRAHAWNGDGGHASATMTTGEVYELSADAASEILARVVEGAPATGFQTPSTAFGADFVSIFDGMTVHDDA